MTPREQIDKEMRAEFVAKVLIVAFCVFCLGGALYVFSLFPLSGQWLKP